jgi:spore coat protein U-like protein
MFKFRVGKIFGNIEPVEKFRYLFFVCLFLGNNVYSANCSVQSAPQIVFGIYDPLSSAHQDINTTIIVNCSTAKNRELLNMDIGFISDEMGGTDRSMKGAVDVLRYALFSNASRTTLITDATKFSVKTHLIENQNFFFPIYGRIFANQSVSSGIYRAAVMMTIDF